MVKRNTEEMISLLNLARNDYSQLIADIPKTPMNAGNIRLLEKIEAAIAQAIDTVKEHEESPKWKKLETREADVEEQAEGYDFMWDGETPELFEEFLVSDGKSVWTDTWTEFAIGGGAIGQGFEYADMDGDCWWMPFPQPPGKDD